jgi:hypothetical protein
VPGAADSLGEGHNGVTAEQFHERMGDGAAALTQIGVTPLELPQMRVEILVVAAISDDV